MEKKNDKKKLNEQINKMDNNEEKSRFNLSSSKKVENRRLFILLGFVGILIIILIAASIISKINSVKIIELFKDTKASEQVTAVYIEKDDCQYCSLNLSNISEMEETYGASFMDVNLSKLSSSERTELASIIGEEELSTPTLVIVGNGEVKDKLIGITRFDTLFNYLKKNSIISKDSELSLNYIDYNNYKKLIKLNDPQIIVLAASSCHYCLSEHPILEQVALEYGINFNYMYMDSEFGSESDADKYTEFQGTLKWYSENQWGTPTTLIVKNGEVIDSLDGYHSYDDVINFLKENGLIK